MDYAALLEALTDFFTRVHYDPSVTRARAAAVIHIA